MSHATPNGPLSACETKNPVAEARKQPPPEKPEAVWTRTYIITSFWVVIVLLGLPMWWQTTSIYRAQLPYQEMLDWSRGRGPHNFNYRVGVHISAPTMPCENALNLVHETQIDLHGMALDPTSGTRDDIIDCGTRTEKYLIKVDLIDCAKEPGQSIDDPAGEADLLLNIHDSKGPSDQYFEWDSTNYGTSVFSTLEGVVSRSIDERNLAGKIAQLLWRIFAEDCYTFHNVTTLNAAQSESRSHEKASSLTRRYTRSFKDAETYHLSFSLFSAGPTPSSWDIQSAMEHSISPWIAALRATSNFTVTTQVQFYSAFSESVQPVADEQGRGFKLRRDELSAFINAAEWPLSPSIGSGPTINFLLYIPSASQVPLTLEDGIETSWLIPQWGGVSILNPPLVQHPETGIESVPAHLSADLLAQPFDTFSTQLVALLGMPSSRLDGKLLPLAFRLRLYARLAAISFYHRASSNLGALARLSQSLSNIPIPKHVAQLVDDTMLNLESFTKTVGKGEWNIALRHAQRAFRDSEKAFFDKSMVGQVYFPDEHKIAVYLPLLGPIGVPLLVGLAREVKKLIASLRSKT